MITFMLVLIVIAGFFITQQLSTIIKLLKGGKK